MVITAHDARPFELRLWQRLLYSGAIVGANLTDTAIAVPSCCHLGIATLASGSGGALATATDVVPGTAAVSGSSRLLRLRATGGNGVNSRRRGNPLARRHNRAAPIFPGRPLPSSDRDLTSRR